MPLSMRQVSANETGGSGSWSISDSGADAVTSIPEEGIGDGTVWADKSVIDKKDGSFDITLSAFGRRWAMEHETYTERYKPINVVFVLDTSSSMSAQSIIEMVDATKQAGNMVLNANPDNRVAVVRYDQDARQVNTAWKWVDQSNYPSTLNTLNIPTNGLVSATNIVAGLTLANNLLVNAPNKDKAESVIVLMSDGAPNRYYDNSGQVTGNGGATGDATSAGKTIEKAAEIANSGVSIYTVGYNINNNDLAWITLNPSNNIGYTAPGIIVRTINAAWLSNPATTLRFSIGSTRVDIANAPGLSGLPRGDSAMNYLKYNTKFYAPLVPKDLVDSFKEVVNDITTDLASPIKAGENLVITDVIGKDFTVDLTTANVPVGTKLEYDLDMHTVTWTIPASQLYLFDPSGWNGEGVAPYSTEVASENMNTVTFKVFAIAEPSSDNYNGGKCYTNKQAGSVYVNYENEKISKELCNKGWVTYEFTSQNGDFRVKKFVDNGELTMKFSEWSSTNVEFVTLREQIIFELYASDIDGNKRQDSSPVAIGTLSDDGMITFSEKVESGWYLLHEDIRGKAAEIFEVHEDWCFYFYDSAEYVVGHSTAFNYDSLYTIINGYSYPDYRNLGYSGLNNDGDLFYIGITNGVYIYASFCANGGSQQFAGYLAECEGYMVPKSFSSLERTGVGDKPYEYFISALNYINDKYDGDLSDNRAITQTVIWALLGAIDVDSPLFEQTSLSGAEKSAVRDTLHAANTGYVGSASIVDLVYLTCPNHSEPGQFEFCQPQLVPVFTGEVSFINKLKETPKGSLEVTVNAEMTYDKVEWRNV